MANSSWRTRRWNIFKRAYDTDPEFHKDVCEVRITLRNGEVVSDDETEKLGDILRKYGVPIDIWQACMHFLAKPDEPERVYLERVMPPFLYWNVDKDKIGPYTGTFTATEYIKALIESHHADGDISFDISNINYAELAQTLFGVRTIIAVNPNVGKEELKDLIADYSDELEELIKDPSLVSLHGENLLGTVRTATKSPGRTKLEKRITELYKKGKSDLVIASTLHDEDEYWKFDAKYIKGVRYRLGMKKTRKKKS